MTPEEHYAIERERQEQKRADARLTRRARVLLSATGMRADRAALEAAAAALGDPDHAALVDRAIALQQNPDYAGRRIDPETARVQMARRSPAEIEKIREFVRRLRKNEPTITAAEARRTTQDHFGTVFSKDAWNNTFWCKDTEAQPAAQSSTMAADETYPWQLDGGGSGVAPQIPTLEERVPADDWQRGILIAGIRYWAEHRADCAVRVSVDPDGQCDCGLDHLYDLIGAEANNEVVLREARLVAANMLGVPFWAVRLTIDA